MYGYLNQIISCTRIPLRDCKYINIVKIYKFTIKLQHSQGCEVNLTHFLYSIYNVYINGVLGIRRNFIIACSFEHFIQTCTTLSPLVSFRRRSRYNLGRAYFKTDLMLNYLLVTKHIHFKVYLFDLYFIYFERKLYNA